MSHFIRISIAFLAFAIGCLTEVGSSVLLNKPIATPATETSKPVVETTAPTVDRPPPLDPTVAELNVRSPYDIESFINGNPRMDIALLWERLGIAGKTNMMPGWRSEHPFLETCYYCEAETDYVDLGGEDDNQVLLRVSDNPKEACRYLIFETGPGTTGFRLIGFIDHDFGRYRMPQHRFVESGGRSFLSIRVQTQSGSGVSMYFDRLFAVRKGKLIELLHFPASGRQSSGGDRLDHKFSGKIADITASGDGLRIEIALRVTYSGWDHEKNVAVPMWSKKQRAVFEWRPGMNVARFDNASSNLSKKELETVYDIDTLSTEDFHKYNLNEIRQTRHRWKR